MGKILQFESAASLPHTNATKMETLMDLPPKWLQ